MRASVVFIDRALGPALAAEATKVFKIAHVTTMLPLERIGSSVWKVLTKKKQPPAQICTCHRQVASIRVQVSILLDF